MSRETDVAGKVAMIVAVILFAVLLHACVAYQSSVAVGVGNKGAVKADNMAEGGGTLDVSPEIPLVGATNDAQRIRMR